MKRVLFIVPAVLAVLVVLLLLAPSFLDWSKYKPQAQTQIKKLTGLDVNLNGDVGLVLLPAPRFFAGNVVVVAPSGSARDNLMSLDRLEVDVAFMPLLSGDVVVRAVNLIKPQIAIEALRDGRQNWQTPEIEKLRSRDKPQSEKTKGAPAISLQDVHIEDGAFEYINTQTGAVSAIQDIDTDIEAGSLQGPFELRGHLIYGGRNIDFEAQTGKIEPEANSISLKGKAGMKERGLNIEYAGVVSLGGPFEMQGETTVKIAPLSGSLQGFKFDPDSAVLKGILTASAEKFGYRNLVIEAGGQKFTGDLGGTLSPMSLSGQLQSDQIVDLDRFLPATEDAKGFDPAQPGAFLPQSISVSAPFEGDVQLLFPGVIYKKQIYSKVTLDLAKTGQVFHAGFAAQEIPGKGSIKGAADLKFANKTVPKNTQGETYTTPTLSLTAEGRTQNAAQTLEAIAGQEPQAALMKAAQFNIAATVTPSRFQLGESTVKLDEDAYKLTGILENKTVNATVGALGGQLTFKGMLEGAALKNLEVQAKHQNLAEALQKFSGSGSRNDLLEKPVDFYAKVSQEDQVYKLQDINASLGSDLMTGNATYDTSGAKPLMTGNFVFNDLVLQSAGPAGNSGGGHWPSAAIDTGWMHAMNADFDIAANSIKYETWDLSKPVIKASLKDGILDIKQMESGLYGGHISITGSVNGDAAPLAVKAQAKLKDVSVEQLVKSFVGNRILQGTGQINMDTDVTTSGASQAALVSGLQGKGTISGKDLVLEGLDLTPLSKALSEENKVGDAALGVLENSIKGGSTQFDTLDGAFTLVNGVANITKLELDGPEALLKTTGNVNLPEWTIDTTYAITLKEHKDEPLTIQIKGSLDNPALTFAKGIIQNYLERKIKRKVNKVIENTLGNKLGLPAGLLGGGTQTPPAGDEPKAPSDDALSSPPAQEKPVTPEDAFKGLLKGLTR